MPWRDRLLPASFRGVEFKVDTAGKAGGRRGVTHEFPKRDTPSDEDLGRRAKRWAVSGYVIGPDYDLQADALEEALNREGHGMLVHPTMGQMLVRCDVYTRGERRTEGGMATFDMTFIERGTQASDLVIDDTQQKTRDESDSAAETLSQRANERMSEVVGT